MFFIRCRNLRPLFSSAKLFSTTSVNRAGLVAELLTGRANVRVAGSEASQFLQGLITNDIHILESNKNGALYTVFLNVQGRIMFDTILFRHGDDFLLNCDANFSSHLVKHLKMYKVRRKIDVGPEVDLQTWAVFESAGRENRQVDEMIKHLSKLVLALIYDKSQHIFDVTKLSITTLSNKSSEAGGGNLSEKDFSIPGITSASDPRFSGLGFRVLASADSAVVELLKKNSVESGTFKVLRHNQGIAENSDEIPFGKCFPLEYNLDLLNGVNFHKGCYIGQELTARTHHTGVVRKRILPLQTLSETGQAIETGQTIVNEKDKNVGQVRGVSGRCAIGLMRVEEIKAAHRLTVKETGEIVRCYFPDWWPAK